MTAPVSLTVDVSAAMQIPGAALSASVVLPTAPANGIAVVCHPGGGLRKDYVDVPVFLGFAMMEAEPDVLVEVPYDIGREVAAYRASVDVSAYRLVGSGHAHNTAGTRELLWHRLHQWAGSDGLFT